MFWITHFASGISLASSFSQSLLWALRQTLPLVFHIMAMICNSQECLESGICMLFQQGTFANWSWFNGMVPKNLQCVGICNRVMHRDLWSYLYSRKGGAIIIGNVYADALARKSITTYSDVAITPSKQPAQREIPSTASTGLQSNMKNVKLYKNTQTRPRHLPQALAFNPITVTPGKHTCTPSTN